MKRVHTMRRSVWAVKRVGHIRPLMAATAAYCLVLLSPGAVSSQTPPVRLDTLQVQVGSRVSADLPHLTRSIRVLDREEIASLPVRTVAGLLEWAASVEVQSRSPVQSDLSIRGGGFEQVVVLVDGVRMSDPQTGHFDLDLPVPLDQVERVEILRGPASALYGADAMGGVVNLVTTDGARGWYGRAEGGSWGTGRVSLGGGLRSRGGWSVELGGELKRSDGHRAGTDYDATLLHLSFGRPVGSGRLAGEVGMGRRDFGAEDFYAPYPSFEKTRTYTSSLRWVTGDPDGTELELGSSFRRHEDEFTLIRDDPSVYQNQHTSSQIGGDALIRHRASPGFDLVVGAEAFQDILRSNSLGDRAENRGAVFGEAVLGDRSGGVVSMGLRHDFHEGFESFLSPSISASRRFGSRLRGRVAVGRSFRVPTWTERYYQDPVNLGREDLNPERAWSGEVGLDVAPSSAVRLSVTSFVRRARDLIDWARPTDATEDTPWETRNVEEADFRGVEGDVQIRGPLDLRWTLGATFLDVESKEASGFASKYALRPLEEQVKVGLTRSFPGQVSLGLHLQRARRSGEDAYHQLDFRGALELGSTRFYLDATNLFDEEYPDITGAMAPGRAFFLGVEVKGPYGS